MPGVEQRKALTTRQVADLFHVSVSTIANWADEGKIPCIRTLGGHRRFDANAIEAILTEVAEAAS